jgi:cell wall-associated NlpC family hydrolase
VTADREDVVAEARRWLRTPFVHQARKAGIGSDCGGLVGGVGVALGLLPPDFWQVFDAEFGGYARTPSKGTLRRICERWLLPAETLQPGCVLLMQFKVEPQHMGIAADYHLGGLSLIHAFEPSHMVTVHRMSDEWRANVIAAYDYPGVA